MRRTIAIGVFVFAILVSSAPALAAIRCDWALIIPYNCSFERAPPVDSADVAADTIRDGDYAATSLNQFQFTRAVEDRALGYSIVSYSFIDAATNTYADKMARSGRTDLVSGSIMDWVRNIFFTTDRLYLVSLELYADEAETDLIAYRNLIAVGEQDSLFESNLIDARQLEGYLGYFRKSDETVRVALTIRSAERNELTLDNLAALGELAGRLAATVTTGPGLSSLIDSGRIQTAAIERKELSELLETNFPREQTITRSATLENARGKITGFVYDFRAASFDYSDRVRLAVQLESTDSLLLRNGATNHNDILSKGIHVTDKSTRPLDEYISSLYVAIIEDVSKETIDAESICTDLDRALDDRFISTDLSVARNAFMMRYRSKFAAQWSDSCMLGSERKFLEDHGIEVITPDDAPKPLGDSIVTYEVQKDIADIVGGLMRARYDADTSGLTLSSFVRAIGGAPNVQVVDTAGVLGLPAGLERLSVSLRDLGFLLLHAELPTLPACYDGDSYETSANKNVIAALVPDMDNRILEIIIELDPRPADPARPSITGLEVRVPDGAVLERYASVEDRKTKGCNNGAFNPFKAS